MAFAAVALTGVAPATAGATECGEAECGAPSCYDPTVRVRPGIAREVAVSCRRATGATVLQQPAHGEVTAVTTDWRGLRFTMRADADAPLQDVAVFTIQGPEKTVEQRVSISVVPQSQNSAPVCAGDRISQRTDGTRAVTLFMHPWCYDPDGDDFTMHGGGPGVHPDAPKHVPAGDSESNWHYRPATLSGSETGTLWAVDSLGARSAAANLEVTVGPAVDRLPECRPNPASYSSTGVFPVHSRPGAIRRFALICGDADGDAFTPALVAPPQRGAIPLFLPGAPQRGWWGLDQWIDTTYVPADSSTERDELAVRAAGPRGAGPNARIAIVPRELPANGGGGCGWSPLTVVTGTAGVASIRCDDDDGDPMTATITGEPRHGVATPAVITPDVYGGQKISIPYVPAPGYTGYDCIKVQVTDGHGTSFTILIDIQVQPLTVPVDVPTQLPIDVPTDVLPPLSALAPPSAAAGVPTEIVRAAAREVLGTPEVKRLRAPRGVEVWAPARLSRAGLTRRGRAPGVLVLCGSACQIRSEARLDTGGRPRARAASRKTTIVATAWQPRVLWVTADRAQRSSLRRARSPRATFRLAIRPAGAKTTSVRRSIRIVR